MATKEERNLNITIKNQEEEHDEVVISISTIFKKLKKYFTVWLVAAVVLFVAAFGYATITTHVRKAPLSALVGFSYSGVEKGLDPNGRSFDANTIKNPEVIESALNQLGMDMTNLEAIRQGIYVYGITPKDAAERITAYKNIMDSGTNQSLTAAERILDLSYFPTQYTVYFDYNNLEDISDSQAVDIFNTILKDSYSNYFYKTYGYNESLGVSVTSLNYTEYDYSEAVDVFNNNLSALKKYVRQISNEDTTRFRSAVTGYTFDDLYQTISTIQSIDLDRISSYISVNNITKDKDAALAYYEYRLKALNRQKTELEEEIKAYQSSIDSYVKDQIIIFGNGTEDTNTEVTQASAQYDKMINQKNNASVELAETKQSIGYYKEKLEALKSGTNATEKQIEILEADLSSLNDKLNDLITKVSDTAEDYYKNVTFKNAYSVLVPATNTTADRIGRIIDNAKTPLILLEGLAIFVYFAYSFIQAIISDSKKKKKAIAGYVPDEPDDDDDDSKEDDDKDEEEKSRKKSKVDLDK